MNTGNYNTPQEIEKYLQHRTGGGPSVHFRNHKKWMYTSEGNAAVVGQPGTGKTRGYIIPQIVNLIDSRENIVVTDTKGEIIQATAGYAQQAGYHIYVVDLRNIGRSLGYTIRNVDC